MNGNEPVVIFQLVQRRQRWFEWHCHPEVTLTRSSQVLPLDIGVRSWRPVYKWSPRTLFLSSHPAESSHATSQQLSITSKVLCCLWSTLPRVELCSLFCPGLWQSWLNTWEVCILTHVWADQCGLKARWDILLLCLSATAITWLAHNKYDSG